MWGYYVWRDRLPFFMLLLLWTKRRWPHATELWDYMGLASMSMVALIAYLAGLNIFSDIAGPSRFYEFGFSWPISSPVQWGLLAITVFLFTVWRRGDVPEAANLSIQAVSAGGWLYEVPWFLLKGDTLLRLNTNNVFYVSFQILSVPILIWLLYSYEVKITKRVIASVALYIAYFAVCFNEPFYMMLTGVSWNWWVRVPTIVMIALWVSNIGAKRPSKYNILNPEP